MKVPLMFTSLGGTRAKPNRRNSSCSSRKTKELPYWCRRTRSKATRVGPTRLAELWQDLMRSSELGFRTTASLRNWAGVAWAWCTKTEDPMTTHLNGTEGRGSQENFRARRRAFRALHEAGCF